MAASLHGERNDRNYKTHGMPTNESCQLNMDVVFSLVVPPIFMPVQCEGAPVYQIFSDEV